MCEIILRDDASLKLISFRQKDIPFNQTLKFDLDFPPKNIKSFSEIQNIKTSFCFLISSEDYRLNKSAFNVNVMKE